MNKKVALNILFLVSCICASAQMLDTDTCTIRFYSHAPLEDIEAINDDAKSMINTVKNEIGVAVIIRGFSFRKALMQEHFNENYMESVKFPKATFKGTIHEAVDWSRDGTYDVSATGTLDIHGVPLQRTLHGKLAIHHGKVTLQAQFMVKLADHKIKIPSLVAQNIAEEVDVFYYAEYKMKKDEKK